jgi:acetolactate synthase-1/2/3 large subunit
VALVTSGPGLTNAVTGIATAHMDSIPMVVISGQVSSAVIGNDAFQEVDAVGIRFVYETEESHTRSCTTEN